MIAREWSVRGQLACVAVSAGLFLAAAADPTHAACYALIAVVVLAATAVAVQADALVFVPLAPTRHSAVGERVASSDTATSSLVVNRR